jgi:excisionase family DNA binding protein
MDEPKVYTVAEFAQVMKISQSMAYLMVRSGKVKNVKFGDRVLIPAKVVEEILDSAFNQAKNSAC